MIKDEQTVEVWEKSEHLIRHLSASERGQLFTQMGFGVTTNSWEPPPYRGDCQRRKEVFKNSEIISEYCFNCYKIVVELTTVLELFKLMILFKEFELPDDNNRKCMVEGRPGATSFYKGLVYCRGLEEGNKLHAALKQIIFNEFSPDTPVSLKRGCSEFALTYPEYSKVENGATIMVYPEKWREQEAIAEKNLQPWHSRPILDHYNSGDFNIQDARVMLTWLRYAKTIGDLSHTKICKRPLDRIAGLDYLAPYK